MPSVNFDDIFTRKIQGHLNELEKLEQADRGIFEISLTGATPETWTIDARKCPPRVARGGHSKADVVIEMAADDFLAFYQGRLGGLSAFLGGRIRVKGDLALAMRLGQLISAEF